MIFKKGQKAYSIFNNKCPRCHEGDYFVSGNPFNFKHLSDTHKDCSVCKQKYTLEPGFYFGAAYVSYAIGVAIFVSAMVATYVLWPSANFLNYAYISCGAILALFSVNFKLSRLLYINMFVHYDKSLEAK